MAKCYRWEVRARRTIPELFCGANGPVLLSGLPNPSGLNPFVKSNLGQRGDFAVVRLTAAQLNIPAPFDDEILARGGDGFLTVGGASAIKRSVQGNDFF